MKATDLMIGDWVICHSTCVRVKGLAPATVLINREHQEYAATEGQIHPIPLTLEILKKNGFPYDYPEYFKEDKMLRLELYFDKDRNSVIWSINCHEYCVVPLKYVHELQHALKLCGIDKEVVL